MSLDSRDLPKKKKNADFWRACRFLYPHRRMVIISVLCALFVGAAFTSGLSTLLPIMRVLINGETVQSWANRQITQQRLGIKLVDNPARLQMAKINAPHDLKGLS
jgi:hypothetical protein